MNRTDRIIAILRKESLKLLTPVVTLIAHRDNDPFKILISTLLSLRTKDKVTLEASIRLFSRASTPEEVIAVPQKELERIIFPVGFFRRKAAGIKEVSRILIEKHGGKVPNDMDALLALPGVGRKTANLVLIEAFDEYGICVDTHVHRISNRLGFVMTKTPDETEMALKEFLPKKYWKEYNEMLVKMGQALCKPVSPECSKCPVDGLCPKIGVERSR